MGQPLEIERKYLIHMPNTFELESMPGAKVFDIVQTYLKCPSNMTRRVRRKACNGKTEYMVTEKKRITDMTCTEIESKISREEYERMLGEIIPKTKPVAKTRYAVPCSSHIWEIDIYPFWEDRAIAEVELKSEEESVLLPPFISVICEVTSDVRYKNRALSENIPYDKI
jgi:CYTH domain-containing protein